jgi:hypothetical protein
VLGRECAVRRIGLDAVDVLSASLECGVRERTDVRPDVDDDVARLEAVRQPVLVELDDAVVDQPVERAGPEPPRSTAGYVALRC